MKQWHGKLNAPVKQWCIAFACERKSERPKWFCVFFFPLSQSSSPRTMGKVVIKWHIELFCVHTLLGASWRENLSLRQWMWQWHESGHAATATSKPRVICQCRQQRQQQNPSEPSKAHKKVFFFSVVGLIHGRREHVVPFPHTTTLHSHRLDYDKLFMASTKKRLSFAGFI